MSDGLTTADLMLIEQKVANEAPRTGVAYLLLILLGFFAAHRFYLGRPVSACIFLASWLIAVAPIWLIVDLFLVPGMVRQRQGEIRARYMSALMTKDYQSLAA